MKRRWMIVTVLSVLALLMLGCGKTKTLHCDRCGNEVQVPADSNMTEDWIIMCEDCQKEVYPDN